ncbi:hypothetical protein [Ferrimonas marina]|uniref:Outer membrane protein beta-barrel domain-containing protein n=1 Tax=Ferrimonas marina TaxID=299255 RepID=A0A1M5VM54_9GAMM|nr:hypothetical protein [Ferrimonas marina]SHH75993.1 hypothetical protein SAMN02745129_2839 [Ferrimonas marina]
MRTPILAAGLALLALPSHANIQPRGDVLTRMPYVMLAADYFNMKEGDLWGITLAPHHYDPNYPDWGYYGGFAWGGSSSVPVEPPGEAETRRYMGRFGLSYRVVADLSFYGGVVRLSDELRYTSGITCLAIGCEPQWDVEKDHRWGAEFGARYALPGHIAVGIGYNTATESMMFTLGLY